MTAIILREIKDRKYTLLAYCAIILGLFSIYIALYPSVKTSMEQFQKIYELYPKGLYEALGIENIIISNIENYLSIEMYSIVWPILALMLATSVAGYTIAGQIEKGVMGFYLALPIGRIKLFVTKYIAGIVGILLFVAFSVLGVIPLTAIFDIHISWANVFSLSLLSLLFMLAVYSFAIFLSALLAERSKVYMVVGGLLVIMYAANIIAGLKTDLKWLQNYSIFHYYNAQSVLNGKGLKLSSVVVFVAAMVVFAVAGAILFKKRDVSV